MAAKELKSYSDRNPENILIVYEYILGTSEEDALDSDNQDSSLENSNMDKGPS